jgi:Tfp pilus assembly protein PilF
LEHLTTSIKLEPLNIEAYHNRGVIYERRGQQDAAIREYKTALRYNPEYEPSLKALAGLGVTPDKTGPKSEAERQAARLAEAASQAARRGNYQEAMKQLREAERIAPRYALIYQYKSNVAYLMGDRQAAIAALRRGLELEPDNALFKNNLKELQARAHPK